MSRRLAALAGAAALAMALAACTSADYVQQPQQQVRGDAVAGKSHIEFYGCGSCHIIPDVPQGRGVVGPPLDGYGNRRTIAGILPNTPENLAAWIHNPQNIDPGNLMPDVGVTVEDAIDIAAYLYSLR